MRRALLWLAAVGALLSGCKASFTSGDPLAYPCTRDGGVGEDGGTTSADGGDRQCPGGWVCGLEGRCHDPDAGSDYLCESESDCAAGWRCGLERRCHDRAVPAEYLCTLDSDCEGQWRCGPDGRCGGQTADEALRPGVGALPMARAFPWPLERAPDLFTAGYPVPFDGGTVQPFAVVEGSAVRFGAQAAVESQSLFYGFWVPELVDAGPSPIRALGYLGGTLLALGDGALTTLPAQAGSPVFPMNAGELRVARGVPLAVAFSDAGYWLAWMQAGGAVLADPVAGRVLSGPDGGARALRDFADLDVPGCASGLVVASDELLGFAPRGPSGAFLAAGDAGPVASSGPAWVFSPTAALFAQGAPEFSARTLRPRGKNLVAISGELEGNQAVVLAEVTPAGAGCVGQLGLRRVLGPAPLCAPAETVVDFQPFEDGTPTRMLVVRCRSGGRERTLLLSVAPGASPQQVDTQFVADDSSMSGEALEVSRAAAGAPAYAGTHGQLWLGAAGYTPAPLLPDRPPQFLMRSAQRDGGGPVVLGMKHGVWQLGADSESPYFYQYQAGVLRAVGAVEGRPFWTVAENGLIFDGQAEAWVAYPQAAGEPLQTPLLASAVTTVDGGVALVVASADTLYGLDVGAGSGELEWKAVPSPGATIRSLVVYTPAPDAGTPLFEGYLLAQDRLFALSAQTLRRWQATELGLPDGEPAKLWADGHRGRLGFRDGQVLSLPARVPIAPALPDREAVDFAQVCGQGYALSPGGLHRLDPAADGGPVGVWTRVELGALLSGGRDGGDFGYSGGRLHALENDLFVFSRYGGAARLDGPAACPK